MESSFGEGDRFNSIDSVWRKIEVRYPTPIFEHGLAGFGEEGPHGEHKSQDEEAPYGEEEAYDEDEPYEVGAWWSFKTERGGRIILTNRRTWTIER